MSPAYNAPVIFATLLILGQAPGYYKGLVCGIANYVANTGRIIPTQINEGTRPS